jgi:deoxyribodipyrimidine photo-lyase
MYKKSIFWFRQDLRTYDNVWLYNAAKNSEKLLVIFILDKNIIDDFLWLNDKKLWFIR